MRLSYFYWFREREGEREPLKRWYLPWRSTTNLIWQHDQNVSHHFGNRLLPVNKYILLSPSQLKKKYQAHQRNFMLQCAKVIRVWTMNLISWSTPVRTQSIKFTCTPSAHKKWSQFFLIIKNQFYLERTLHHSISVNLRYKIKRTPMIRQKNF